MPRPRRERPDPELNDARVALREGNLPRAARLYERVLDRRPSLAEGHYALGIIAARIGELDAAIGALEKAISIDGASAPYHYALGTALRDAGELAEAAEEYAKAGWLDPSLANCHADGASVLERLGRLDEAEKAVARALKADPAHEIARILSIRIALQREEADQTCLRQWADDLTAFTEEAEKPAARILACDTLIDVREALDDHAGAFETMTRCNALVRESYDIPPEEERDAYLETLGALAHSVTPERAAAWREQQPADGLPAPALLVGFPRSGTTLTERALDAHPRLTSLEEKPTFESVKSEMGRMLGSEALEAPFHESLDALTTDHLAHLRHLYWRLVAAELDLDAPPTDTLVLDKLPIRIAELPLVNRLFPDARVLVALRDPRDVCLSCFRQRFQLNMPMSFFLDLEDTARLYDVVISGWLAARPHYSLPWKEFRYEDTVADFEPAIRALLDFLGLEWDDAVLAFHEHSGERASLTPSYRAVRREVYTTAVGRWRRYAEHLEPILPTLRPLLEALGYSTEPA